MWHRTDAGIHLRRAKFVDSVQSPRRSTPASFFFLMIGRPPSSPLFPYTPLSRSRFVHDQVPATPAAVEAGPPVAGFRLFLAVSAYPASRYHDPSVENVGVALAGATAAMTELDKAGAPSAGWFHGIATFLHTYGSGNDGHAGWSTDCATIPRAWLRAAR